MNFPYFQKLERIGKIEKKEDQVVLGRWEIPSEIREAIVAP